MLSRGYNLHRLRIQFFGECRMVFDVFIEFWRGIVGQVVINLSIGHFLGKYLLNFLNEEAPSGLNDEESSFAILP